MTKEDFRHEVTELMIRAVKDGVPAEEVGEVTYQSGATLFCFMIGTDRAVPKIIELAEALRQLSPQQLAFKG